MIVLRGDVVLVEQPFASGVGSKRRPVLVVQNDRDNVRLLNTIVVQITSNISRAAEPTQFLIDTTTVDGRQSGLFKDSVVNCVNLFTIERARILKKIGILAPTLMVQVETCLKASLSLP